RPDPSSLTSQIPGHLRPSAHYLVATVLDHRGDIIRIHLGVVNAVARHSCGVQYLCLSRPSARLPPATLHRGAMRLIGLAVVLAVSLTVAPLPAGAQQTGKVPRIGYLVLSPLTERPSPERAAFVTGLRELGWVEGRTIAIEYRSAKWNPEMFDDLAEELVRMKVDVIVTAGGEAAPKAVRRASSTIPIAMAASSDAIGMGLIASPARPGGSVTGLSLMTPELGPKRLELLKEAAPKASRLAVLWNPTYGDAQIR